MRQMKLFIIFALIMGLTTSVFAFGDFEDNSNTNQQGQLQGQIAEGGDALQGQGQQQGIDSDIDNRNTNLNTAVQDQDQAQAQGQAQGQGQGQQMGQAMGQGQIAAQGQGQSTAVNIEGDDVQAFAAPDLDVEKGVSSLNAYSIFGGVGIGETEEYSICIDKIEVIKALQDMEYITPKEAQAEARAAFEQLKDSTKPKRLFGFGPRTRGRHLLNLFGLLATDSWVDEDKVNAKILEKRLNAE